jgi:hypothetical protein
MWKLNKAIDENETSLNANTVHHWSVTPDELPALTSRLLDYTRRVVGSVDAPWSSCTDVAWTTWWSVMPLFRLPVTPWRLSAGSKRKEAKNVGLRPLRIDTRGGGGCEGPRALDPPPLTAATASAVSSATRDATACRIVWLIMDCCWRLASLSMLCHGAITISVYQTNGTALLFVQWEWVLRICCYAQPIRWKVMAESTVRWLVVREKHCSG